jgi:hypothetical protein
MLTINSSQVKGEPGTGFEKADGKGPFECGNCSFMRAGHCHQPTMMAVSKQPKDKAGHPAVGEHDCCEYVDRVGKAKFSAPTATLR